MQVLKILKSQNLIILDFEIFYPVHKQLVLVTIISLNVIH